MSASPPPSECAAASSSSAHASPASSSAPPGPTGLGTILLEAIEGQGVTTVMYSFFNLTDGLTLSLTCQALQEKKQHYLSAVRAVTLDYRREPYEGVPDILTPACFFHHAQPSGIFSHLLTLKIFLFSSEKFPTWFHSLLTASLLRDFPFFFPHLATLDLSGCKLDQECAVALGAGIKAAGGWPSLQNLDLSKSAVDAKAFPAMAEAMRPDSPASHNDEEEGNENITSNLLPNLRYINLQRNMLNTEVLMALHVILPPTLTGLHLSNTNFDDDTLDALAGLLKAGAWPNLEDLDLSDNSIGTSGLTHLVDTMEKRHLSCLRTLDLTGNPLTDVNEFTLALAHGACPLLETLALNGIEHLYNAGLLLYLADALRQPGFPHLHRLDLGDAFITDDALLALGNALHVGHVGASLRYLSLGGGSVGEEAFASFLEMIFTPPTSGLTPACCGEMLELRLCALPVSDAQMVRVAAAIKGSGGLRILEECVMPNAKFGDAGLACLSEALAAQCPRLKMLDVAGARVGNKGVLALVGRLVGGRGEAFLPALRTLRVRGSRVVQPEELRHTVARMTQGRPRGLKLVV